MNDELRLCVFSEIVNNELKLSLMMIGCIYNLSMNLKFFIMWNQKFSLLVSVSE